MRKSQIMYMEAKGTGISGPARIGRMTFSKSGRSIYYRGRSFAPTRRGGLKTNYFDCETGEEYWISGCKKKGGDRLYPGTIEIDADARVEYWTEIRKMPECKEQAVIRCKGKWGGKAK